MRRLRLPQWLVATLGVLTALGALAYQAEPARADRVVAPTGSDAGTCELVAPCVTFDRAYRVAAPGEAVVVAPGTYPTQTLKSDPTKTSDVRVSFRPAVPGTVVVNGLQRVHPGVIVAPEKVAMDARLNDDAMLASTKP